MKWEIVIGLEIHVQLATRSKLFSTASTQFGQSPNTQVSEVDMALPGTLPTVNKGAIEMAVKFGLAVGAEIGMTSVFERKNYFYADLPKGYQTTQLEQPIVGPADIEVDVDDHKKIIRLHHAHLEEDAGKSIHDAYPGQTAIDLNRAGTPLIEIVTEPDMRSAAEAVAFLRKIHTIITYIGISDGDMSQGSMRCDANVSVRPKGESKLGTRTEIKNINSFRFVEKAIQVEAARQIALIEDGGKVTQETRLFDPEKAETRPMRSKEVANDYRYFPCPDLLPVVLEEADIDRIQQTLPELPEAKQHRFVSEYKLTTYDASLLTQSVELSDYFELVTRTCADPKLAANWVMGELSAAMNRDQCAITDAPISAVQLGHLIKRITDGTISSKLAKRVFEVMWETTDDADTVIEREGLKQNSDTSEIERIVDDVIKNSTKQVENYVKADEAKRPKMKGFFVGQIMKATKGQANPQVVNQVLDAKLKELIGS